MWTNFTNVLFLSCIVLNLISIKTNPFSFTTTILVLKDVNNIYWGVKRGTQEIVKPLVQVSLFVFISLIIVSFCLSWFVLIRTTDFCLIIYFNWHKAHLKSIMYYISRISVLSLWMIHSGCLISDNRVSYIIQCSYWRTGIHILMLTRFGRTLCIYLFPT